MPYPHQSIPPFQPNPEYLLALPMASTRNPKASSLGASSMLRPSKIHIGFLIPLAIRAQSRRSGFVSSGPKLDLLGPSFVDLLLGNIWKLYRLGELDDLEGDPGGVVLHCLL